MSINEAINNYINANNGDVFSLQIEKDQSNDISFYVFSSLHSHRIQLSSQITDYWLENNTAVQDTISIQPVQITLSGLVGEVTYKTPSMAWDWLAGELDFVSQGLIGIDVSNKLYKLSGIIPTVDNYTQLAKNAVSYMESAVLQYAKTINALKDFKSTNKVPFETQKKAFRTLQEYLNSKTPIKVKTPYETFENMYIQNVDISQENTSTQSNLTVTLKQVTFKEVQTTKANPEVFAKYNAAAQAEQQNNGYMQGRDSIIAQGILKFNPNAKFRIAGQ